MCGCHGQPCAGGALSVGELISTKSKDHGGSLGPAIRGNTGNTVKDINQSHEMVKDGLRTG